MKIVNPNLEGDYHIHSIDFSDGSDTIEDIVRLAGQIGLKEIAITDHSQAALDKMGLNKRADRKSISKWKNTHNNVKVIFGIEGDILNEQGDICQDIQGETSDFLTLSAHSYVYSGKPENITEAYINAIKKHKQIIKFISHPCSKYFSKFVDIKRLIDEANKNCIPMEFDYMHLANENKDLAKLQVEQAQTMLKNCDRIYVNSDAHNLHELRTARENGLKYLRKNCFLK